MLLQTCPNKQPLYDSHNFMHSIKATNFGFHNYNYQASFTVLLQHIFQAKSTTPCKLSEIACTTLEGAYKVKDMIAAGNHVVHSMSLDTLVIEYGAVLAVNKVMVNCGNFVQLISNHCNKV